MIKMLMISNIKLLLREPGVIFWVFGFPVVMAWVLGAAFSGDKKSSHVVAWVGDTHLFTQIKGLTLEDKGGQITNQGINNEVIHLKIMSESQARTAIKQGKASLVVFANQDTLTFELDPQNQESKFSYLLLKDGVRQTNIKLQVRPVQSKGSRYVDFLVPGLMAFSIMNSCIWGIGWGTIELRMKKLLRRMVATPMPPWALTASQFFNRFLISVIELAVLFGFSSLYFDMEVQGSWLTLILLVFCGNFAFAGIAILMASRTASTTVGNGLVNLVTMPMMILSGIFFSYQNFPSWSWPFLSHLPLSLLADGLRSVINEGTGLLEMSSTLFILGAIGLVSGLLGLKLFKWY